MDLAYYSLFLFSSDCSLVCKHATGDHKSADLNLAHTKVFFQCYRIWTLHLKTKWNIEIIGLPTNRLQLPPQWDVRYINVNYVSQRRAWPPFISCHMKRYDGVPYWHVRANTAFCHCCLPHLVGKRAWWYRLILWVMSEV